MYNRYFLFKHALVNIILGKASIYPEKYNIEKSYFSIWLRGKCKFLFCFKRFVSKGIGEIKQKGMNNTLLEKWIVMNSCSTIINERLDIANFIQDSVDFQVFKQLFLSSRHKLLIPLVNINLTKKKKKDPFGNKSAFERNLTERTDFPVFSIEDAV